MCAHVCVCECVTERATARERKTGGGGGGGGAKFLMTSVFCISFFIFSLCCRPTWNCWHKHHKHTLTLLHTWQQAIHYCCHESMGKCTPKTYGHRCCQQSMREWICSQQSMGECTPTTYGHGCCLHNRVWVNTHLRCMATDIAFTKEYGWMHTHDVQPWMLPSLKARVPAHPRHSLFEFLGDI